MHLVRFKICNLKLIIVFCEFFSYKFFNVHLFLFFSVLMAHYTISKFIAEYENKLVWTLRNTIRDYVNFELFDFVAQEYLVLYNDDDLASKDKKLLKYIRANLIELACRFIKKNQDFLYEAYDIIGLCYCNNDEKYEAYRDKYINNQQHVQIKSSRFFEELHEEFNKIYNIALSRIEEEKKYIRDKEQRALEKLENQKEEIIQNTTSSFIRPNKVKIVIRNFNLVHILKLVIFSFPPFLGLSYLIKFVIYIKNIP